ncbi:LLM class flavin-dependent oxidoreductase [Pokkaliibacter plantistimulans]|uniref:Luciferase-like monooxygenase n=2 Tax=Pseudomonadota TaxID=1224 RepID=A0A2S5KHB1_9PROT|nr:LLM class flavin-dependent oxidoreductase [Pokkaliibacter plantistimulans]PPC74207.1 LLM class flavin-dependent oxidoreductase [Pokkaliibacter plantistimulans]
MKPDETPLSLLDLVTIGEGHSISEALETSTRLAQAAEQAGYLRYWVAEHHNLIDIASAAPPVVLSHIGAKTSSIRLGSGGIMLPNHAPLMVAEQFGTLESLYPGRIDLGLGRAPGTDMATARALRRDLCANGLDFSNMVEELMNYFVPAKPGQRIKAIPGAGLNIPVWLLGSSTYSALLAAEKGLPLAFASHFAPDSMSAAIDLYRASFQPSEQLDKPYVIVCVNAVAADTQKEAEYLATTELQKFLNLGRGVNSLLPKPVEDMSALWQGTEAQRVLRQLRESAWGAPEQVCDKLHDLVLRTGADEVMLNSWIHDPNARIHSYELIANAWF